MTQRWEGRDLLLELRIQPRASRDELVPAEPRPRLRLRAPAIDGRANEAAIAWLASTFGVPRSHVVLERGARSRDKLFRIRAPALMPPAIMKG
jgi:uncharacterized protein (TIGR00251 family)